MLKIRKEQQQALESAAKNRFIANCKKFLEQNEPEWCSDKSDEDKQTFIEEMIDFAHEHHIYGEINIQQLIRCKIEYDFSIPLSPYRKSLLDGEDFDEDYRIKQFEESLASGEDDLTPVGSEDDDSNSVSVNDE